MNNSFYEQLALRIGAKATKLARRNAYATLALVIVGVTGLVGVFVFNLTGTAIGEASGVVLDFLAFIVWLITRMQLAKAMSKYIGIKIPWFSLPRFSPIDKFDTWLDQLKKTGKPGL
jgi:uncharacterized membrane protein YuzA (DUF378 family)